MKQFTIKSAESFTFTSKWAANIGEVFTAIPDLYKEGYVVIGESERVYIIPLYVMAERLKQEVFVKQNTCIKL